MKETAAVIILFIIVKLTSYGVWNVKKEKNYMGLAGTLILDAAIAIQLVTLLYKIFR